MIVSIRETLRSVWLGLNETEHSEKRVHSLERWSSETDVGMSVVSRTS